MTVSEYVTRFTQLSRYAPNEVDTDEKKQECFLNGLNDGLAYALEARDFVNFQAMVDKALVLENRRGIMDRKRKSERQTQQGSSSSKHTRFGSSSAGPTFRPGQQVNQYRTQPAGQGFTTPQRQVMQRPNNSQPMRTGNQNMQRTQTNQGANQNTAVNRRCYNCGEEGHFANQCPKPRQQSANNQVQTPVSNRNANSAPATARQNYARGRVNHVAVEAAQEAPDVVLGMFLVNANTAVVLFDSGASHSFIAAAYVEKHNIPISMLKGRMIVSSPGGDMPARHVCPKVNLNIRG